MTNVELALVERLKAALAEDDDHMAASGDDLIWLAAQLACWPDRVDAEKTTNDRYLRMSAAATLKSQAIRIEALEKALTNIATYKLGGPSKPGQIKSEHRAIITIAREALSTLSPTKD